MRSMVWLSFEFTYLSNIIVIRISDSRFDYPLNLHISQTPPPLPPLPFLFDYPLNLHISQTSYFKALNIVEFDYPLNLHISQTNVVKLGEGEGLIILWIYISLKLDRLLGGEIKVWLSFEFTYLSNTSSAMTIWYSVWLSFEFTYLSNTQKSFPKGLMFDYPLNLHISQTSLGRNRPVRPFDYPLNLHISQTMSFRIR